MGVSSITEAEIRAFLTEGTRTGKLSFLSSIGHPLVTPVWFVLEGDTVVFNTGKDTAKGRYLARDPQVSPCVDLNLPCGFTCGANGSGGDHFWVIASYQQIATATAIAAFAAACVAYLVPQIQWWTAPACTAVVYLLKPLAENEPRVTNHGVWAAIYFTHPWSPQDGHY